MNKRQKPAWTTDTLEQAKQSRKPGYSIYKITPTADWTNSTPFYVVALPLWMDLVANREHAQIDEVVNWQD